MSSTNVEKIKERLDIVDVVGSYVELKKAGATYKAKCPFHNEKTPSFTVSPERGTFYCFGCHAKGDIFSFVEQIEGLDFKGALKVLAERAGVTLERENEAAKGENDRLYAILETAKTLFAGNLGQAVEVKAYLAKRGIKDETMQEWGIGYALPEWRSLYDGLRKMKYSDAEMERAGLIKRKDSATGASGENHYDAFRDRVMFPISDSTGRVVGFSGRTLSKDPTTPKYINSPETPLFNKSELLYGFHKAKSPIRKIGYSILVEGQMDLIMCHQAGYANTVAASGTALTSQHLERLKKLSPRIIMAYDSDNAGLAAAEKNARLALKLGLEVKIAALPQGLDPADLILQSPKEWADAVRASRHIVDFELDRLLSGGTDNRAIAASLKSIVLPFISDLGSAIEKSHYVAEAAKRTGIREEAIWDDLKGIGSVPTKPIERQPIRTAERSSMLSLERRVMGMIYWKPAEKDFQAKVVAICGEEKFLAMKEETAERAEELVFETENYYEGTDILERDMQELLQSLEKKCLQVEIDRAQAELRLMREGSEVTELLTRLHELAKRLEGLKKARI